VRILKSLKAEQAAGPEGPGYRRAARRASDLGEATRDYLRRHDLDALVYPATGCPAPPLPGVVDESYRCEGAEQPLDFGDNPGTIAPMLSPATGLPVLTLPGPAMPGDQRVGLSLLGPRWSEGALIRMGYGFELGLAGQ
jgi:amidase